MKPSTLYIIGTLVILLLVSVIGCYNEQLQTTQYELSKTQQAVTTWKDKHGNAHLTISRLELEKKDMKHKVDSIAAVLKVKPKNVQSYGGVTARIDTLLVPVVEERYVVDTVYTADHGYSLDTARVYDLYYQDSVFLSIQGTVGPKKSHLQVSLEAELRVAEYYRRKGLFGGKEYYLDFGTNNPYVQLTDGTYYKVKEHPSWKVRPGIGLGFTYNPITKTFHPGFQAGLYLFKSK